MACSCSIIPIVNEDKDCDVYLVLDTFGEMGLAWRDTDEADTERAALVRDLLDGQDPVRIVAFNTAEGWSRDVTEDIADELHEYCADLDEIYQFTCRISWNSTPVEARPTAITASLK